MPAGQFPTVATTFVGRQPDLAVLSTLLAGNARLVTLSGPGGCGKTRLALALVERLAIDANARCFVALEALRDPALVASSVAAALAIAERPDSPALQTLTDALAARTLLLVLDNCEHLLPACAALAAALIDRCPGVSVLATSRSPLGVAGEHVHAVAPLTLPAADARGLSFEAIAGSEAVQLFSDRARQAQPAFALTPENAATVAALCRTLDALPLAIELAAARTRLLEPAQILARLAERFRLLRSVDTGVARHQTIQAAIEWSYDLLSAAERALFATLGTFAGSCSLDAIEAVARDAALADAYPLDLLEQLVRHNMVLVDGDGTDARFHLLDSLRAFALDRLHDQRRFDEIAGRHAAYFRAFVWEAMPELTGPQQASWLDRIALERDNLRAALDWFAQRSESEPFAQLAGALWRYWYLRGEQREGRERLGTALANADRLSPVTRALVLGGAGWLAKEAADFVAAQRYLEQRLEIARAQADTASISSALNALASLFFERGDYPAALPLYEESLVIARAQGDEHAIALTLNNLGQVLPPEERARARALYRESLARASALEDREHAIAPLNNLGLDAFERRDYAAARDCYDRALALAGAIGWAYGSALLHANLGHVAQATGDHGAALALQRDSLLQADAIGHIGATIHAVRSLGILAVDAGEEHTAALLLGAAEQAGAARGVPLPPAYAAEHAAAVARLAAMLDETTRRAAWLAGAALTLAEATAAALAFAEREAVPSAAAGELPQRRSSDRLDALSQREREVLDLLAGGASNKEIAARLTLSVRTVEHHVARIYRRLGVRNRRAAMAAARTATRVSDSLAPS